MSEKVNGLSDKAKAVCVIIGYVGGCVFISYLMYKALAVLVGKAVVKELIKAGVVTVL